MVKKLLRHEFTYYARILGVLLPIMLALGILTHLLGMLPYPDAAYQSSFSLATLATLILNIAKISSVVIMLIAIFGLVLFTTAIGVVRFYKNMYSAEGYLTFALPVSHAQHIFVKLLMATAAVLASWIVVSVSGLIAFSGEPYNVDFGMLFTAIFDGVPAVHVVLLTVEAILTLIVSIAAGFLLYYACITIGQTAKKNRILLAIGVYVIYSMASQFIGSILSVIFMFIAAMLEEAGLHWLTYLVETPYLLPHVLILAVLLGNAILGAVFYFVTHAIMKKKLNLE